MKNKLLIASIALALAGCENKPKSKLELVKDDPEQLAKLPAATQVALVLETPIWMIAGGVLLLGLQGIPSKIKVKVARKDKDDE